MTPWAVTYADPEPNGLASMLGGLIEANLTAHPERTALLAKAATYWTERAPNMPVPSFASSAWSM